jgi:hypothetical protein
LFIDTDSDLNIYNDMAKATEFNDVNTKACCGQLGQGIKSAKEKSTSCSTEVVRFEDEKNYAAEQCGYQFKP